MSGSEGVGDATIIAVHDPKRFLSLRYADLIALNDGVQVRGSVDSHVLTCRVKPHALIPIQQPRFLLIVDGSR